MRDEAAVAPVVACLLLVGITVILGALAYSVLADAMPREYDVSDKTGWVETTRTEVIVVGCDGAPEDPPGYVCRLVAGGAIVCKPRVAT